MMKRVLVAMSGGVDSSVTAALLQQQDYAVEGVTMKLTAGLCCDIGSAQAVCEQLRITHHLIDAREAFARDVVDRFTKAYLHGRTPNPCITCNDLIKFHLLLDHARAHGFDHLATGHYARIECDEARMRYMLRQGVDAGKDQSYFLYRLTQDQMRSVLFPLGGLRKSDVRALAREIRLPAAERPESQDICFVPDDDYRGFLREHAPEVVQPGEIILSDGTAVGRHEGIAFFTVGQRRHLGVAAGSRRYVLRTEPSTNRVVLGTREELLRQSMTVSNVNLIMQDALLTAQKVMVKVRYRSPRVPAMVRPLGADRVQVDFEQPFAGICPGQAAVFYVNDTVFGGGTID